MELGVEVLYRLRCILWEFFNSQGSQTKKTNNKIRRSKMTKIYKAVFSTLAMLCLLFVGSGEAWAQRCQARATPSTVGLVRAEGIAEMVADIEVECRRPSEEDDDNFFGSEIEPAIELEIELNTNITNEINDDREVQVEDNAPNYDEGGVFLVVTTDRQQPLMSMTLGWPSYRTMVTPSPGSSTARMSDWTPTTSWR